MSDDLSDQPAAKRKSSRKWLLLGCFIPAGVVLLCGGGCVGFAWSVMTFVKKSPAYTNSLTLARNRDELVAELGEPMTESWWVMGERNISGGTENVDLTYQLTGPKGTATITVIGSSDGGQWTYRTLKADVDGSGKTIALLRTPTRDADEEEGEVP